MKDFSKYLSDDSDNQDEDMKSSAKMDVLNELRDMAMNMMGNKVKNHMGPEAKKDQMSEISVAAKDPKDLAKGLDLARNVLPQQDHDTASAYGTPDSDQYSEDDDMSIEEIEDLLNELQEKRRQKMSKDSAPGDSSLS